MLKFPTRANVYKCFDAKDLMISICLAFSFTGTQNIIATNRIWTKCTKLF
jgi:hypothetical protein